jgi:exodeoxyribonuclease V gamma subunit
VVNDLRKFIAVEWKETEIKLDETRDVTELFTPKSLRNKEA